MPDFLEPIEPSQPDPVTPEPEIPELPPTEPEPLETPRSYIPWMMSFMIVAGFVLIQQFRFKKKHDPDILAKRVEKDEKKTIVEIYHDMIRLYKLVEDKPLNTNSVSSTMVQITSQTYVFNRNQVKLASLAINDALYSNKDSHPLAISSLLNLYLSLEKSVQTMSPVWKHYVLRVLFNFR